MPLHINGLLNEETKEMPKISVIVPVYNVERYLSRCIDSILIQTFQEFELILVDDGSPDNCGAICDEYAGKDSRIHVIHQKNGGLSAARNAGIDWVFANSDSDWISFIDSDDWVHCKYLEALFEAVQKNEVLVSISEYDRTNGENPEVDESRLKPKIWKVEDYFVENNTNAIIACGKLFSRSCFTKIRFPFGKVHEDEFTTYKLLFMKAQVAVIHTPLYAYFINANGISEGGWSPKRLFAIEAMEERIQYFDNLHMKAMKKESICCYIYRLQHYIKQIDEMMENKYLQERKLLLKKLRTAIVRYRKEYSLQGHEWAYNIAFPKSMWVYWTCKACLTKK